MFIKKLLYKLLPFNLYLKTVSRLYFITLKMGMLHWNRAFDYPYYLPCIVREGDVVIDIGANLGYYSVLLSKIVGRSGHVYSVEPVKQIREVLEHNSRYCNNITIYPFALGDQDKQIVMGNDSLDKCGYVATGVNVVLDAHTGMDHAGMEFPSQMRRGSELFGRLERLDFIKCDIEGYEDIVIPEILPVIESHKPTILMETGGDKRVNMVELLESLGYQSFVLKVKTLHKLSPDIDGDILFIHPSHAIYSQVVDTQKTSI